MSINLKKSRRKKEVKVGSLLIGGDNPIWVQSMTTLPPSKLNRTLEEINALVAAGCEIVRVAVPSEKDALNLKYLKEQIKIPLVADIHFNYKLGLIAIREGVDKIRLNPGNITKKEQLKELVLKAKDKGIPIRIGINSGSLDKEILEKYGEPTSEAMVESAVKSVEMFESYGFRDIVLSLKSSNLEDTIKAYEKAHQLFDYPLHIGLTEAGFSQYGIVKSAIGLGNLLLKGIGDTIRVSLVGNPVKEVTVAFDILKATGCRIIGPEIIACPTCGRLQINLEKAVKKTEELLKNLHIKEPIKISILGCGVNGPGEALHSDIGVVGGRKEALIYKKGNILKKVKEEDIPTEVAKIATELVENISPANY